MAIILKKILSLYLSLSLIFLFSTTAFASSDEGNILYHGLIGALTVLFFGVLNALWKLFAWIMKKPNEKAREAEKALLERKNVNKETIDDDILTKEILYFENPDEFVMYINLHQDSNIVWESSDKYIELFQKGYHFFEQKQITKAIDIYKECLDLNPIGISARFELVECYIANKQLSLAKKSLYEMTDFLYEDAMKAKFYRRLGYIATEKNSYKEAYACYIYSLKYENNPSVMQELIYIDSRIGDSIENIDIEKTLAENNIPLLKLQEYVEASEEKPENALTQSQTKNYKNNFCRICGEKLNDGSRFCHECGAKVLEIGEQL